MNSVFLGIDTSNYTTSVALIDRGTVRSEKQLLTVAAGERGLRQSDAVFQHIKNLPDVLRRLYIDGAPKPEAVGVSDRPCGEEGSYMPCFLAGVTVADAVAQTLGVPLFRFTHQAGHIAAVLHGAQRTDLAQQRFLAFHVSGGTTQAVLVEPDRERVFSTRLLAQSLDLKAGQAIDRVGTMLGLSFPCGAQLDLLAQRAGEPAKKIKPSMKEENCSLSGIENRCRKLSEQGVPPEEIAAFCIRSVIAALEGMLVALRQEYPTLPVIFSGGVSANRMLREEFIPRFGAVFAPAALSTDNAVGIALLAQYQKEHEWQ